MRWVKHLSMAHNDAAMSAVLEDLGPDAYGVYWLLVEMIAAVMEKDRMTPELIHSDVKWSQITHCSARRFRTIAERLAKENLIVCQSVNNRLKIEIPKILKYKDEYAKKSGHYPESKTETDTDREQIQTTAETPPEKPAVSVPSYTEFPLAAAAVREDFPAADDELIMSLAAKCSQSALSVNGQAKCVLSDSLVADAVREARAKTPKQNSAGLYLKTVPQVVKTWMIQGRKPDKPPPKYWQDPHAHLRGKDPQPQEKTPDENK